MRGSPCQQLHPWFEILEIQIWLHHRIRPLFRLPHQWSSFCYSEKMFKMILFKVKIMYCCKPMSFFRSEISLIFNISWNMPYIDPLLWIWRILKNNEKEIMLHAKFGSKRVRCCEDLFCNVLHLFSLNARSPFEQLWIQGCFLTGLYKIWETVR